MWSSQGPGYQALSLFSFRLYLQLGIRSAAKSCLANSLRCSCPAVATSCTSVTVPGSLEYSRLQRDLPELRHTSQPRRVFASYNPGCRFTTFKTSRSKSCLQYLTNTLCFLS
ncbi:hypothetical protein SKAU_G00173530 [Synaphobranchus kaupii]|uniref:Uncharacterized protein n=1 Tax=Synaphobranchus kaupii TaxID=118154 RepID=A0A9Q1J0L5_SYNKA|nr:hypothetical protein SKAU_G00173530 [Synaphobranchus kaupii]